MQKNNWKLFLFILLTGLCRTNVALSQDSLKVYADPQSVPGIKASKFIDKIEFIPLETSKQSKYSNGINFLVAADDIVILDKSSTAIYFFDKKTGKFLHKYKNEKKKYKISNLQYAPLKKALLVGSDNKHYSINDKKRLQLVKRWKGRDISKYVSMKWIHLDENFREEKLNVPAIALNQRIAYFDGGFLYRNYSRDKTTKDSILYRLIQYGSNNQVKHRYFPYLNLHGLWADYYKYNLSISAGGTLNDSSLLFQLDFDPTIYELKPDTIIEKYKFVFPLANVMPADFNSLSFNNNIDVQKYKEKNAKVFNTYYSMFEHGKYLLFSVGTLSYDNRQFMLLNNVLYDVNKVTTDSSIYNLPPGVLSRIFGQDKDYLYATEPAEDILKHKAALLKNKDVPQDFKDYLSTMTIDDNDIILRIKLK